MSRSQRKQSAARRLSVITIDQAIAGASNVLIAILAARLLGVASFGLFGIVFLVYVMVQGVSRALICDPLLIHPVEAQERPHEPIATSCLLGLGLGTVVLAAGFGAGLWDERLGNALIVLAICVPLLILQDLGRYLGFATQRPGSAVVLDVMWLGLVIAAVVVILLADARTLVWFIVGWAGSGAVTGLLVIWQYRGHGMHLNLIWLRHTWTFSWRYLISYTTTQAGALGVLSSIGGIAGTKALGGVQGTLLLVRPFGTVQSAAVAAGVAEISRSAGENKQPRRAGAKTSALTTGAAVLNGIAMLALPDRIGEVLLGAAWHATQPLLLPTGVQLLWLGLITGPRAGLLGLRAVKETMSIDVASTVVLLGATVCGALAHGALGALWAVAIAQGLTMVVWWTVFVSRTSQRSGGTSDGVLGSRVRDERIDVGGGQ